MVEINASLALDLAAERVPEPRSCAPHDSWAGTPDMNFHSRVEVEQLLTGFEITSLREQDEDGEAVSGPKHWHVFHVIARKP